MTFAKRIFLQREYGVAALLVLMIAAVSMVNHDFLTAANARDILLNAVPVAIVACGLTFVIVLGEIDISVGSLMGLLAVMLGILTSTERLGWPVPAAIGAVLLLGSLVGFVNGALVVWGKVPSIIVTLGMLTALQGATIVVMNGQWIKNLPEQLRFWGTGTLLGVPVPICVAALVLIACAVLATQTPLGRRLYASGSNAHAAELSGLRVGALKIFAFSFTGFLTAVATLVSVPRLSVIAADSGKGFELTVVTAVVVGGASLRGGRGTIGGSLLAALLLGAVGTALIFLHLGASATIWERAIQGAFILTAVLADHLAQRRAGGEA